MMLRMEGSLSSLLLFLALVGRSDARVGPITEPGVGEDNWGSPKHKIQPYTGESLPYLTQNVCKWKWGKLSETFKGAVVNWYKNTPDWATFKGYDMVPELHDTLGPRYKGLDTTTYKSEMVGGRCFIPEDETGARWSFDRIGPFKSTGDYDWWQFAFDDTFESSKILKEYPDGYYILNHFTGAVDKDGNIMEFPPIHVHHVHCSPGKVNPQRSNIVKCLAGNTDMCAQAMRTIYEQHGDYQCEEKDGGTDCLLEDMPKGYAKLVDGPITINGELNDARAKDSPEIEWYYQTAIRWIPKIEAERRHLRLKPLSFHYFWSPGRLEIFDQSTMVNTFKAPTGDDSMLWYTGRMHYSGDLVRGKLHAHNTVFKESFFFSGTPEQLGLTGERFTPKSKTFEPILLKNMGFASIEESIQYVLSAYHQNTNTPNDDGFFPKLICHGHTRNEDVEFPTGTYKFDRRAPTWCTEWSFKEGEPFTVVGYNQHAGGPPGPHMPDRIPPWLPGHLHWFIFGDTHDGKSHYEYGFYSQEIDHAFGTERGVGV